jgi:ubiquinone biosynthesis protein
VSCVTDRIDLPCSLALPHQWGALLHALVRLPACLVYGGYHGLRFLGRLVRSQFCRGPSRRALLGASLADLFESLGGGFLKLGQILSTRVDLLPDEVLAPMRRLRDGIRPMSASAVVRVIERSFGRPLAELFANFDPTPVGSASIAQVHRATIRDTGEEVAVKVRRPGVGPLFTADALLLGAGAWALGKLPWFRGLPLQEAVREVIRSLVAQTDFLAEAQHLRRVRQQYEQFREIRVPRVVDRWCSADMVTMEYIAGSRGMDDQTVDLPTRRAAAVVALRLLYRMIFEFGYFHCDPHPANLRVGADGTVVVIDLGFVAEFPPGHRRAFAEFFVSIATQNVPLAAQIVCRTALSIPGHFDPAAFELALAKVIKACAGRRVGEFQIVRFITSLFAVQQDHGVRGSPQFTLAILTLLAFEGVLKGVAPDLDFQQEAIPILLTALAK